MDSGSRVRGNDVGFRGMTWLSRDDVARRGMARDGVGLG